MTAIIVVRSFFLPSLYAISKVRVKPASSSKTSFTAPRSPFSRQREGLSSHHPRRQQSCVLQYSFPAHGEGGARRATEEVHGLALVHLSQYNAIPYLDGPSQMPYNDRKAGHYDGRYKSLQSVILMATQHDSNDHPLLQQQDGLFISSCSSQLEG